MYSLPVQNQKSIFLIDTLHVFIGDLITTCFAACFPFSPTATVSSSVQSVPHPACNFTLYQFVGSQNGTKALHACFLEPTLSCWVLTLSPHTSNCNSSILYFLSHSGLLSRLGMLKVLNLIS